jgi:pimeloyl-ACP methyl ester carboxylesterase
MSIFILIHGAWHGKWCWKKLKPLLRDKGHIVLNPDLPGLGDDLTPINKITMQLYVDHISAIFNQANQKVILVGHSMAGIVISELAEQLPEKIESLVYLCAFMPQNGQSLMDIVRDRPNPHLSLSFSKDFISSTINEECIENGLFNLCSREAINYAKALLKPQAHIVFETKVKLTETNYGSIPKVYIECTKDNAISIELQRKMYSQHTLKKVFSIDTDHSPFFSTPEELAAILDNINNNPNYG